MSVKRARFFAELGLCTALVLSTLSPSGSLTRKPATMQRSRGANEARTTLTPAERLPRAPGFSWGNVVETSFDSRRLGADHTVSLRFMAAYEGAFRGVLLTDSSGSYHLGLAPYSSLGTPALEITVGGATFTAPLPDPVLTDNDFRKGVPRQPRRRFRQLTVTRRGEQVSVYLDGARVGGFVAGAEPLRGALRLGRLAKRGEIQDQFYGLLDELAIFERALGASEVLALARAPRPAAEAGASLPAPRHETRLTLPFAEGEVWLLIQGVNSSLSHHDLAAFSFDFLRVDPGLALDNPKGLPGGSHSASEGARFVAPADGKVVARVDCFPDDNRGACPAGAYKRPAPPFVAGSPANRNLLCVEHGSAEVSCALHLQNGSVRVALGEHVKRGQELAKVGRTGAQRVHLHFAVSDLPEPSEPGSFAPLVTFPIAFSDYDVSADFGAHWRHVARGVPSPGEWLRRASAEPESRDSTGKD